MDSDAGSRHGRLLSSTSGRRRPPGRQPARRHWTSVKGTSASSWSSKTARDPVADLEGLQRVAGEVADHADAAGVGQLDQQDHVGAGVGQRPVHRVPGRSQE